MKNISRNNRKALIVNYLVANMPAISTSEYRDKWEYQEGFSPQDGADYIHVFRENKPYGIAFYFKQNGTILELRSFEERDNCPVFRQNWSNKEIHSLMDPEIAVEYIFKDKIIYLNKFGLEIYYFNDKELDPYMAFAYDTEGHILDVPLHLMKRY